MIGRGGVIAAELLFGASLRLDRKERSAEDEIPPILGIVELEDASALCGNGCIRVRQEVLLQRMSLADITTVDIHFKEHTMYPKNQHEYRNEQFEIWHMDHSIVNDRPMFSEHEIKKFFIESWNFYKKGWRGTQVTTFMKEWFTHNLNESVRFFKMRKTVDEDVSNFRFAYVDQVKPVIVLGGSPTRARTARSIDQSAEEYVSETPACPAALTGQTKCCRLSTTLTNEMMGPQYSFVETTTERNLTVCGGTCGTAVSKNTGASSFINGVPALCCHAKKQGGTLEVEYNNGAIQRTYRLIDSMALECGCG